MQSIFFWILPPAMIFEINLVGRLMVADLVSVTILGLAIATRGLPRLLPGEKYFYGLAFVWLLSLMLTDIYRGTEFGQYSRGWANIAFFILNYAAMRAVTRGSAKNSIYFMLLILVCAAIKFYFGTGNIIKTGILIIDWRFGYGIAFTAAVLVFIAHLNSRAVASRSNFFLAFGVSALNLFMNARSLFGQSAMAAIIGFIATGDRKLRLKPSTFLPLAVLGVAAGLAVVEVYSYTAKSGLLGIEAQAKYERQAENDLGLLLGGRTELLGSLDAIADSPVIGYGSYARDRTYALLRLIRLQQARIVPTSLDLKSDRIPTHSFLFGAWVEAGILGAVFWVWVLYVTIKCIILSIENPNPFTAFVVFVGLLLAWDILFSPFGLDRRIVIPAMLNLILVTNSSFLQSSVMHK